MIDVISGDVKITVRPKKTGWDTLNVEIIQRKVSDAIRKRNDDNLLILLDTVYIEFFARMVVLTEHIEGIDYRKPSLGVPAIDILPYFTAWYDLDEDVVNLWCDALIKASFSKAGLNEAPVEQLTDEEKN